MFYYNQNYNFEEIKFMDVFLLKIQVILLDKIYSSQRRKMFFPITKNYFSTKSIFSNRCSPLCYQKITYGEQQIILSNSLSFW